MDVTVKTVTMIFNMKARGEVKRGLESSVSVINLSKMFFVLLIVLLLLQIEIYQVLSRAEPLCISPEDRENSAGSNWRSALKGVSL